NFQIADSNTNRKDHSLRFTDVGLLPKRMLAPIEGYDKIPLVTLEEAVKPLVKIVPKVERNVKACLDSGNEHHIVQLKEVKPEYNLLEPVPLSDPFNKLKNVSRVQSQPTVVATGVETKSIAEALKENFTTMQLNMNTKSQGQS
ncbi:unnamed protein product, partial [Rotaria sp. Silwood2]